MYSITSKPTFDHLESLRQSIERIKPGRIFALVGNKCDEFYDRQVTTKEGVALSRQFGCEFLEISAKTAQNVETLFTHVVRALRGTAGPTAPTKQPKKLKCIVM